MTMTGAMSKKIIDLCCANYPNYGENMVAKGVLWMKEFQKYPDDLMETAILSCIGFCKKFPTVADIKEAIRDLQYEKESAPKQLQWEVKRNNTLHQQIMDMAMGKTDTKEFMTKLDVTELMQYAKVFFPDISEDTVKRNYSEFASGIESQKMCFACRTDINVCLTNGYQVRHSLDKNGYVSNEMLKCQKNV